MDYIEEMTTYAEKRMGLLGPDCPDRLMMMGCSKRDEWDSL